jgi:predicted phosphate transport protein (TIGR00153 family)
MIVNRVQILELLTIQDSLADTAEDIAVLLTVRHLKMPADMIDGFRKFRELSISAFDQARGIIADLNELMESGFGGAEAEKIRKLVRDVAFTEHKADMVQRRLMKLVLSDEENLSPADMNMWLQMIKEVARLSNLSENLANRVQMTLSVK